jgi:hypothetical protein
MKLERPKKPAPDSRDRLGELENQFKELFARQAGFKRVVPKSPPDVRRSTVEGDADAEQTKRNGADRVL